MGNVVQQVKLARRKAAREKQTNARLAVQKSLCSMGPGAASMACIDNPGEITDFYFIEPDKIGEGSYGRVCRCCNVSTGALRAVKMLRKVRCQSEVDRFRQEIVLLRQLDHPHIAKLFEHFESDKFMYMVMQLCEGGDLFDHLVKSGHCTEVQTATIMQQLFRAVFYMHSSNVAHRDLKLENLMLLKAGPIDGNTVKIIDFGGAKLFDDNEYMRTKLGAPYFIAPQVLAGKYNELVDSWTLGVVMYCLMCGYPPFFGDSDAEVLAKVRVGYFYFNASDWKHVAEPAKNLIRKLLKVSQTDRITVKEALFDEWTVRKASLMRSPFKIPSVDLMRAFGPMHKLKRAALTIMAAQLDEEFTGSLIGTFMSLDESGEGTISHEELREGLLKSGTEPADIPKDLEKLCRDIDSNGSGEITISEFLASTLDPRIYTNEEFCWAAFRIFDRNCDGKISVKELRDTMTNGAFAMMSMEEKAHCTQEHSMLLDDVDEEGDGGLDFTEFMHMMLGTTKKKVINKKQKSHEDKVAGAVQLREDARRVGKSVVEFMKEQGGLQRALEDAAHRVAEEQRRKAAEEDEAKKAKLEMCKSVLVEKARAFRAAQAEQNDEIGNARTTKIAGDAGVVSSEMTMEASRRTASFELTTGVSSSSTFIAANRKGLKSASVKLGRGSDPEAVSRRASSSAPSKKEKKAGGLQARTAPTVTKTVSRSKTQDKKDFHRSTTKDRDNSKDKDNDKDKDNAKTK